MKNLSKPLKFVILFGIPALFLWFLMQKGAQIGLLTRLGLTPGFRVNEDQGSFQQNLPANEPDDSNLFHSPTAVSDGGIFYQDPAPTFEESRLEIDKIREDFPILIDDVRTSAGITTSISMYVRSADSRNVLSIHINGINYNAGEASDANPQYKAFVESLQRARTDLERRGVNPDKLLVSFGTRQYIVNTANNWARPIL